MNNEIRISHTSNIKFPLDAADLLNVDSVIFDDCKNITISNARPASLENHIVIANCADVSIYGCTLISPNVGIYVKHSSRVRIYDNYISNSSGAGILFENVRDSFITRNIIRNTKSHGIYLSGSCNNVITSNNIALCRKNGIQLNKGANESWLYVKENLISGNFIKECEDFGVALFRYAYSNFVVGNFLLDNIRGGVGESYGNHYFPVEEWGKDNIVEDLQ